MLLDNSYRDAIGDANQEGLDCLGFGCMVLLFKSDSLDCHFSSSVNIGVSVASDMFSVLQGYCVAIEAGHPREIEVPTVKHRHGCFSRSRGTLKMVGILL